MTPDLNPTSTAAEVAAALRELAAWDLADDVREWLVERADALDPPAPAMVTVTMPAWVAHEYATAQDDTVLADACAVAVPVGDRVVALIDSERGLWMHTRDDVYICDSVDTRCRFDIERIFGPVREVRI